MVTASERVEALARKLCLNAGHNPEAPAVHGPPLRVLTPNGEAVLIGEDDVGRTNPLWHFWRYAAHCAIKAAEESAD